MRIPSCLRLIGPTGVLLAVALSVSAQPSSEQKTTESDARLSTDHVRIRLRSGGPVHAAGSTVPLTVEVEPRKGMHVYAPGDHDYRIVTLTLQPHPFIQAAPVSYPQSETYFFAPLNERVPVYMKPFALTQEVRILDTEAARDAFTKQPELSLTGTLAYQACDDRLCFNPVSIPLSWRFTVAATDRKDGASK
jgi:DsbC/DsbD-like thiol-disulfide interchange protein